MATNDFITWQVQSDGSTRPAPLSNLPMSIMPVAKSRLDVHLFNQTICTTARRSGHFDITGLSGLSGFSGVRVYQSDTPGTNKGALHDEPEFEQIQFIASLIGDTTIRVRWLANGPVVGNYNLVYQFRN